MKTRRTTIVLALLIVGLGTAWLLNMMNVIPGTDWIWIIGMGVLGILLLAMTQFNRFTFIIGTSLIVSSVLSVLRKSGQLENNYLELPVLFITIGILLMILPVIPAIEDSRDITLPLEGNK